MTIGTVPRVIQMRRQHGLSETPTHQLFARFSADLKQHLQSLQLQGFRPSADVSLSGIAWAAAFMSWKEGNNTKNFETGLKHSGQLRQVGGKQKSKGNRQVGLAGEGYTLRPKNSSHNAYCAETQVLRQLRATLNTLPSTAHDVLIRIFVNFTACVNCELDMRRLAAEFPFAEVVVRAGDVYRPAKPVNASTWTVRKKEKAAGPMLHLPRIPATVHRPAWQPVVTPPIGLEWQENEEVVYRGARYRVLDSHFAGVGFTYTLQPL